MLAYRPITDDWILARSKVKYYGALPAGFLHRARALLAVGPYEAVLHVCGGMIRNYPYKGFGPNDQTLDLDPDCAPDYLRDARDPLPEVIHGWPAILIDRPYSAQDAARYKPGKSKLPAINPLLRNALSVTRIGGRVGVLDYIWPHPGQLGIEVAVIAVYTGRNNRPRTFTVFERVKAQGGQK